jgi:hypothetical protein
MCPVMIFSSWFEDQSHLVLQIAPLLTFKLLTPDSGIIESELAEFFNTSMYELLL